MRINYEARGHSGPSFPLHETRGRRGDTGEIILINGEVPRSIIRARKPCWLKPNAGKGGSGNEEAEVNSLPLVSSLDPMTPAG